MPSCHEYEIAIDRRPRRDLGRAELLELEQHLSTCPSCGTYARDVEQLDRALGAGGAAREPDWSRIHARAVEREARGGRAIRRVTVASALLLLVALYFDSNWLTLWAVGGFLNVPIQLFRRRARIRDIRRAAYADGDLLDSWSARLGRELLQTRAAAVACVILGLAWAAGAVAPGLMDWTGVPAAGAFNLVLAVLFVGIAFYWWCVHAPRLARQREDLTR